MRAVVTALVAISDAVMVPEPISDAVMVPLAMASEVTEPVL